MAKPFWDLTLGELTHWVAQRGFPEYQARSVFRWVYGSSCAAFAQMTNVPAGLRAQLAEAFSLQTMTLRQRQRSQDTTEKFLFALRDDNLIEAVSIPARGRVSGCLSSQAGCAFNCVFCASGARGLKRNLSCAEIIEEVFLLGKLSGLGKPTHLVFMGMGEPLANYEAVLSAIRRINAPECFNLGARRITVSTCGIVPGILRLAQEPLQIELSVSLHAAEESLRTRLMPVNKKYPLKELMTACREYVRRKNRQVTFEYILIDGVNAGRQDSVRLAALLRTIPLAKVNLIPANAAGEKRLEAPSSGAVRLFAAGLKAGGIPVTVRSSRGADIAAACGQLRARYETE